MSETSEYREDDESEYPPLGEEMPYLQREDKKNVLPLGAAAGGSAENSVVHFDNSTYYYDSPQGHPPQSAAYGAPSSSRVSTPKYFYASPTKWAARKPAKPARRSQPGKRKPCNCTRSQCLKLYCDCFANGEFCLNCNCKDCHNNLEFNHERSRAIKQSLEKNPHAFKPKIGVANKGVNHDMERLHQKGCHCKKSNCLKNYCECYEAKVACTDRCKCRCCRNTEADRQVRFTDRFPISSEFDRRSPASDEEVDEPTPSKSAKTYPWYYLTDDVVETTTMCMMGQAVESEQKNETIVETINALCREFGDCVGQVFETIRKTQQHEMLAAKKELMNPADFIE